ncbi:MAG: DMT family transporter [Alphaproteobacteria bacterium]|nr:DMT family transporter [Alphaproteobacteria bacterium]
MLAAATNGLLIGAAMVASRFALEQMPPATLALLRYSVGALCLLPPLLLIRRQRFERRDLLPVALLGIAQFGVLIALLNWGLRFMPAARASLIFATFPLLTMLLAAALRLERMTLLRTAGVSLSFAGVAFVLGDKALGGEAGWWGEVAVFASALTGAVCSVFYKPYVLKYPALQVSWFAMVASVAFLLPLATGEGLFSQETRFDAAAWGAVLFVGLASALAYFLWLYALARISPTRVTVFVSVSPPAAALLGWALLGETLSPLFLLAVACLAFGLWLAQRPTS